MCVCVNKKIFTTFWKTTYCGVRHFLEDLFFVDLGFRLWFFIACGRAGPANTLVLLALRLALHFLVLSLHEHVAVLALQARLFLLAQPIDRALHFFVLSLHRHDGLPPHVRDDFIREQSDALRPFFFCFCHSRPARVRASL